MPFDELTREQKAAVKQRLLCERLEAEGRTPAWGELADADKTISDEECRAALAGVDFSPGDFPMGASEPPAGARTYAMQLLLSVAEWAAQNLTDAEYAKSKDRALPLHYDESQGIAWARERVVAFIKGIRL